MPLTLSTALAKSSENANARASEAESESQNASFAPLWTARHPFQINLMGHCGAWIYRRLSVKEGTFVPTYGSIRIVAKIKTTTTTPNS